MKLNLVPTYVAKEGRGTQAVFVSLFLVVLGIIAAVVMIVMSGSDLAKAKEAEAAAKTRADQADTESKKADAIMGSEVASTIERNLSLAKAMDAHSTVYPDLYDKVRGYIPPYFRLTAMSAAPAGEGTSIVTLTGVVDSYQQYADLMLALLRIPGASNVSRTGYQLDADYVPALTPEDQSGRRIKPGAGNEPDDPIERLNYLQAKGSYTGYQAVSNFGGDPDLTRGPMPGASLITVTVTIPGNLMTPDPRATLAGGGGAAAPAATPAAGGGSKGKGKRDNGDD